MSMSEVSAGVADGIEDPEEYEAMQVIKNLSWLTTMHVHYIYICIVILMDSTTSVLWFQVALQMSLNEDDDNQVPALPRSPAAPVLQSSAPATGEILDQR